MTILHDSTGLFPQFQPAWAAHNIATFPIKIEVIDGKLEKKPAVKNYGRMGLPASADLARKPRFANHDALAFIAGQRSRITVLDVDTTDEKILIDALDRHGRSPLIVRTASGKYHCYYRHAGERRMVRPWKSLPIDILGGGMAVAPPSMLKSGESYQIIEGSLADIERLPPILGLDLNTPVGIDEPPPSIGRRNVSLWRHAMREAHACDNLDQLIDKGREFNMNIASPLDDTEVIKTAASAWAYTERGSNRFGQHGAWLAVEEIATMIREPDAFFLLAFLRAHNGPWSHFMCANGLAERFGWDRRRFSAARSRLIGMEYLRPVRQAGGNQPALYRWVD
jgi:hypothetical protein